MRKIIDAEFEQVSGPSPVRWEPPRPKARSWRDNPISWAFAAFLAALALFTALMGASGADIDTTDDVETWRARQPAAVEIR